MMLGFLCVLLIVFWVVLRVLLSTLTSGLTFMSDCMVRHVISCGSLQQ